MNNAISSRPMETDLNSTLNISLPLMRTASGLGMALLMTVHPTAISDTDPNAAYARSEVYDQVMNGSTFQRVNPELGSSWGSTHYIGNTYVADVELAEVAQSIGKMISDESQPMDPEIRAAFSETRAQYYL